MDSFILRNLLFPIRRTKIHNILIKVSLLYSISDDITMCFQFFHPVKYYPEKGDLYLTPNLCSKKERSELVEVILNRSIIRYN